MINDDGILKELELFRELSDEERDIVISHLSEFKISKGQMLFETKDFGDEMYILMSGKIRISRQVGETELVFAVLDAGAFFGEMAVVDELHRSASAFADEDCILQKLTRKDLENIAQENPLTAYKLLYSICKVLSRRIRRSNEAMETYIRINRALVNNPNFRDLYHSVFG